MSQILMSKARASNNSYSIRDLASEFDITTRTIRFYESENLLHPTRNGTTRVYSEQDRVHLILILRGKRLGLTLAESKQLIEMYDPSGSNLKQLQYLLAKIQERKDILNRQFEDIKVMQKELDVAEQRCLDAMKQTRK